ncbi:hypothetical protein PsorP6_016100 [Peronosclerospora sorghi]|uniref:Uncharacterized protein n=1 Tax=Peronosclerospora sorghi TaxID=230839 RepID=A0ACC0WNT1_9STRA|nr:hypothetical protein PsorP6_016100 [Peronosclerospora sorghi]
MNVFYHIVKFGYTAPSTRKRFAEIYIRAKIGALEVLPSFIRLDMFEARNPLGIKIGSTTQTKVQQRAYLEITLFLQQIGRFESGGIRSAVGHVLRVLLRHNVTAIPERYILKRWRWDTLLLDNEGSAEIGPAVSADVSVAVRAQISDSVAEVAGVVSEVAQVAAAAVSITVAEADATPEPAAAFADFQHHVQHLLPVPPVVRNPSAVRTKGRSRNASRIPSGVVASMAARHKKRRRCGRCREYGHDGRNHDRIMMERSLGSTHGQHVTRPSGCAVIIMGAGPGKSDRLAAGMLRSGIPGSVGLRACQPTKPVVKCLKKLVIHRCCSGHAS